jgi:predicted nucleic acid-binding protein
MIYFDTAYIVKCYIHERGSPEVRNLLHQQQAIGSCALARVEFATSVLRAVRERRLDHRAIATVFSILDEDEQSGVWNWFALSPALLEDTFRNLRRLAPEVIIRAGDAIHLACAREHGFREIYTNDRHLIAAARHFGLNGVSVIP